MAQVAILLLDAALVLAAFVVTAACGWWAVAPFRRVLHAPLAVAPLAGLVILPVAALAFVVLLGWTAQRAALAATIVLCAISAAVLRAGTPAPDRRSAAWSGAAALAATLIAIAAILPEEIRSGEPALAYMHGSDHLGYAHFADWLRARLYAPGQILDPTDPYPSYVARLFEVDPRAASFMLLALVGMGSGRSGTFSYDLACAIVSAVGAVGLAGAFARGRTSFAILVAAMSCSPLVDQAHNGYFAKLCAGFAIALAARIAIASGELRSPATLDGAQGGALLAGAALAAGAAALFNGVIAAMAITCIGLAFVAWTAAATRPAVGPTTSTRAAAQHAAIVVLLAAVAFATTGTLTRPIIPGAPGLPLDWGLLLARALGIESQVPGVTAWFGVATLGPGLVAAGAVLAALCAAIRCRAPLGGSMIIGSLLFGAVTAAGGSWTFYQAGPLIAAWLACGVIAAAAAGAACVPRAWRTVAAAAALAAVGLQAPRFIGAVAHYGLRDLPELRFVRGDADRIEAAARPCGGAYVDFDWHVHTAIYVMVEMGWRGLPLQWAPAPWNRLVGYRQWPAPTYADRLPLRLVRRGSPLPDGARLIVRTRQLDLIGPADAACAPPGAGVR